MKRIIPLLLALLLVFPALGENDSSGRLPFLPDVTWQDTSQEVMKKLGKDTMPVTAAGMEVSVFYKLENDSLNRYYGLSRIGTPDGGAAMYIYKFDLTRVPNIFRFAYADRTREDIVREVERFYEGHLEKLPLTAQDITDDGREKLELIQGDNKLRLGLIMLDSQLGNDVLLGPGYADNTDEFHVWKTDDDILIACAHSNEASVKDQYILILTHMQGLAELPMFKGSSADEVPSIIRSVAMGGQRDAIRAALTESGALCVPDEDGSLMVMLGRDHSYFDTGSIGQLMFNDSGALLSIVLIFYPEDVQFMYQLALKTCPDLFPFEMTQSTGDAAKMLQRSLSGSITTAAAWVGGGTVLYLGQAPAEGAVYIMQVLTAAMN